MVPVCEAIRVVFLHVSRIDAYVISNTPDIVLTLEDQILTTEKLGESPYALPFKRRLMALRKQQDEFHNLLLEWRELQRVWLKMRALYDCGAMTTSISMGGESSKSAREIFEACEKRIRKLMNVWRAENNGHEPSPKQIMSTPKIVNQIESLNKNMIRVQMAMEDTLERQFWLNCPRTRYLNMEQCFRLNAFEFCPEEIDTLVPMLFPGIRRLLLEPIPEARPDAERGENENSSSSSDEELDIEDIGLSDSDSSQDSDEDIEGIVGEGILSGQHFLNLMRDTNVLPASTLLGFGTRAGQESNAMHNGNDHYGFHFKSPVQLFKKKKTPNGPVWTSRPLVVWLMEAETGMRQSLLDAVDHCYNACALFSQSLSGEMNSQTKAMSTSFYTWLFSQPAQVVTLAYNYYWRN